MLVEQRMYLLYSEYSKIFNDEYKPLEYTQVDLVEKGLVDPLVVFLKYEPHNPKKVAAGRYRNIQIVSLVDQFIDRICCSDRNQTEILNHKDIPCKSGMSLSDEGMYDISCAVRSIGEDLADTDMKGWDETFQECEYTADFHRRTLNWSSDWWIYKVMRVRYYCLARSMFVLPSGKLYCLSTPGKMISGWYNTASTNTWVRAFLAFLRSGVKPVAMGDDCVEAYSEHLRLFYERKGHDVKQINRCSPDKFEFCSHLFDGQTGIGFPIKWEKTIRKLLATTAKWEDRMMLCSQWRYENRHHPQLDIFWSILCEIGFLSPDCSTENSE
jgi:hypothetical protein